jgi:hypothetical protein
MQHQFQPVLPQPVFCLFSQEVLTLGSSTHEMAIDYILLALERNLLSLKK